DLARVDELHEVECLAAFDLGRLDLVVFEQNVVALRHLVALDDLVAVNRADPLDDLLVVDPLAARLVDLVELDRRPALGRGVDLDRDRHERETDLALPVGACGHCGRTPPVVRGVSARAGSRFRRPSGLRAELTLPPTDHRAGARVAGSAWPRARHGSRSGSRSPSRG